jgi:hypothetical protein
MPSDTEGVEADPAHAAVPPPTEEEAVDVGDEQLADPDDVDDDGIAASPNAHGGEQPMTPMR